MNILVAIDASKATAAILNEIKGRSWGDSPSIHLLYVVNPVSFTSEFVDVESYVEAEYETAKSLLQKSVGQLAESGITATAIVIKGKPAKSILVYAKDWGADMILLGSHGHSSISTLLLGRTVKEVLRQAPCSVEIVRTPARRRTSGEAMKILLATDGSACSLAAAQALAEGVWNKTSEVRIISVVNEGSTAMEAFAGLSLMSAVLPEPVTGILVASAKEAVKEAKMIIESAGMKVTNETLFGEPKSIITEHAKDWGADLIVVGSHGRRGFDRLFEGSVSESVALHAPCSVAVIHDPVYK
jgi:nucleotide-binding universal stress UspA family protein